MGKLGPCGSGSPAWFRSREAGGGETVRRLAQEESTKNQSENKHLGSEWKAEAWRQRLSRHWRRGLAGLGVGMVLLPLLVEVEGFHVLCPALTSSLFPP